VQCICASEMHIPPATVESGICCAAGLESCPCSAPSHRMRLTLLRFCASKPQLFIKGLAGQQSEWVSCLSRRYLYEVAPTNRRCLVVAFGWSGVVSTAAWHGMSTWHRQQSQQHSHTICMAQRTPGQRPPFTLLPCIGLRLPTCTEGLSCTDCCVHYVVPVLSKAPCGNSTDSAGSSVEHVASCC
jgi:hypothetical protein